MNSINAALLKNISLAVKEREIHGLITNILSSCLDRATFGKNEYTHDIDAVRVNEDDIRFIVYGLHALNFEVSSRLIHEDSYYEITVRW